MGCWQQSAGSWYPGKSRTSAPPQTRGSPFEKFSLTAATGSRASSASRRYRRTKCNDAGLSSALPRVAQVAQRPLDLIELGTSAGLNLYWDRYHYRYEAGTWGDPEAPLQLGGEERSPVPAALLDVKVQVRRRCGIDLNPIDVTTEEGVRLLRSFDPREEHRIRLEKAAQTVRADPPELLRGDYLDVLPPLLAERDAAALTVVFQTLSTVYLTDNQRARVSSIIEAAAKEGPLAWISTPTPEEHGQRRGDYPLEIAVWPGIARHISARMNVRAEWIDWVE